MHGCPILKPAQTGKQSRFNSKAEPIPIHTVCGIECIPVFVETGMSEWRKWGTRTEPAPSRKERKNAFLKQALLLQPSIMGMMLALGVSAGTFQSRRILYQRFLWVCFVEPANLGPSGAIWCARIQLLKSCSSHKAEGDHRSVHSHSIANRTFVNVGCGK